GGSTSTNIAVLTPFGGGDRTRVEQADLDVDGAQRDLPDVVEGLLPIAIDELVGKGPEFPLVLHVGLTGHRELADGYLGVLGISHNVVVPGYRYDLLLGQHEVVARRVKHPERGTA